MACPAAILYRNSEGEQLIVPIALMCTTRDRIPVSASTNQGPEKHDLQGPACAMACPAAILYRNYLWQGRGQVGRPYTPNPTPSTLNPTP